MALTFTHKRNAWLQGAQWIDSPPFQWGLIDFIVVHWPGSNHVPDGDPLEPSDKEDLARYLRDRQAAYLRKGYNLGYSIPVDWLGGTWEVRGDEFRCAANAPAEWNQRAIALYIMTDLDGAMTSLANQAVEDMIRQIRSHRPNARVVPHGDGRSLGFPDATPTQCPGPIALRIPAWDKIQPLPPSPTPPPVPPKEDDMSMWLIAKSQNQGPWFAAPYPGAGKQHIGDSAVPRAYPFSAIGTGRAFDVGSGKVVTSWDQCQPTTMAQIDKHLGK